MRRSSLLLVSVLAVLIALPATAAPARKSRKAKRGSAAPRTVVNPPNMPLAARLQAIIRVPPIKPRSEFAVAVAKVGDAEPLVTWNADASLILASTTKVFTTAAALDRLGIDYKFRTRVLRDGEIGEDGTLAGHLVVYGGGDPAISGRLYDDDPLAVFRPWAESLAKKGIRKVRDGLLLDASFFDDKKTHPDWPAEQEQYWWQAPTSALSYNDNVVLVRATGVRPGAPALLGFYPAGPPLLTVIGKVLTVNGGGASVGVRREAGSRTVLANGLVGTNRTWSSDITVPDPPLYLGAAFAKVLREAGIELMGGETVKVGPPSAAEVAGRTLMHTHETPILPVLAVCNKRSQSFYAEQILKTLGAEKRKVGTWPNGVAEVGAFLKSLGLDPALYQLTDGSGRSRNNRTTAKAYLDFLQALATRWKPFDLFESTLAVTGSMDGSLRHRMTGDATRGKVMAKTGNIAGVVTLCGYVVAQSGTKYAFSILINGGCQEGRGHAWQDRFITELARFG